ncbi:MAG: hypothetical protein ACE5HS_01495 [bacterium]
MTVEFVCVNCNKDVLLDITAEDKPTHCPHCSQKRYYTLSASLQKGDKIDRCALCGKIKFYVQKDFNPRLGLLIFGIGVLFSYHTYGLTLLIATIIDFFLYKVLKTVTICYHCRAIYRGFQEDPAHRGFDHNLAVTLMEQNNPDDEKVFQETAGVK